MTPMSPHLGTPKRNWRALAAYFRQCLEQEQVQRLQVSLADAGHALLRDVIDSLITGGALEVSITDPSHVQQIRQLLARGRQEETRLLYYAFPVVAQHQNLIPVCFTQVQAEPGPKGGILLRREGELLINRRFLTDSADLTETEVSQFARQLGRANVELREVLADGEVTPHGLLFRASPDMMTRSLQRELEWLERQTRLSSPLTAYLEEQPGIKVVAATPGVTVVRSNPAQDRVLRQRSSVLQAVAGPPGTGKTQTIINLIASAVCDGHTVLFISKNNPAVDNVYDAFLGQNLFPGILRLGSQDARKRTVQRFHDVLASLQRGMALRDDQAEFESRGLALNRKIALLEEELAEVSQLQAIESEMALLLRRTEANLQESGLYRYATDLAAQITPANADQIQPGQLVGLRRLAARTANWHEPPSALWERVLLRLGFLTRLRRRLLVKWLQDLALPAFCTLIGLDLHKQLESVLRIDAVYPFLLATARHQKAAAELAAKRTPTAIRTDLDGAYEAKVQHSREHLRRRWAVLVTEAQPRLAQLRELGDLFERMAQGSADPDTRRSWWRRYGELLTIFPVICSTNLSLAGAAPNEAERFDLVILDEASQSDIASFLPALYRARHACVMGDQMQLRHISNLEYEQNERLMKAAGIHPTDHLSYHKDSAFDRAIAAAGKEAFTLLNRHYRCVPEIIGFCNQHFYGNKLKLERTGAPHQPLAGDLPAQGFLLDDIASGQTQYRTTRASKSASNTREAERVISLVQRYIGAGVTDIGVVTPFRAQRELLDRQRQVAISMADEATQEALSQVEIGTIHTFQGGQHQVMLFSTVVAPGAREGTIHWFEENRNLLNVAISRAKDLLIVVGHRGTLERAGGILKAMVTYAVGLASASGALPPLPPGLQPARLGLLPNEDTILRSWLSPPGAVAEVLNGGEQVLYREVLSRVQGQQVIVAPKMRVLDCLEPGLKPLLTQREQDYAFRAHFDLVVVELQGFKPVAAVELDGARHDRDPLTLARDRLKNSVCEKAGLPLLRVRWNDWEALAVLDSILEVSPHT